MALNWQHIKGIYGSEPLYTFIEFSSTTYNANSNNTFDYAPTIWYGVNNSKDKELGHIITEKATGQKIEHTLTINDLLTCNKGIKNSNSIENINDNNNNFKISFSSADTPDYITLIASESKNLDLAIPNGKFTINANTILSDNSKLEVGTNSISRTSITKDYVEAPYFNATSDMRAKENIIPFNGDAIKIITSLPTYTFNYKNSDTISYGILAQDLVNTKINDFSFIENANASGENNDYMKVKESKLIYLLIEGIKAQQKEIDSLKAQLEELKHE